MEIMPLEQIKALNNKVQSAVSLIEFLRHEKAMLVEQNSALEVKLAEYETLFGEFKESKTILEKELDNVLTRLKDIEDDMQFPYADGKDGSIESPPILKSGES